jgi:hypothetical protein
MDPDETATNEEIRKWMLSGGRPLEMQVAAQFSRFAHTVEQSSFYTDPESHQAREIDVIASLTYGRDFVGSVVIECKSKNSAFVVLLEQEDPRLLEWRCLSTSARGTLPPSFHNVWIGDDLAKTHLFRPEVPVGHSVITKTTTKQAGKTQPPDKAWQAALQAAKAAQWLASRWDGVPPPQSQWHVAFPVVVTDGILATARLKGLDDVEVQQVDHARFALKWPLSRDTQVVIVDFIRASYVPTFADGCRQAIGLAAKHAAQARDQVTD